MCNTIFGLGVRVKLNLFHGEKVSPEPVGQDTDFWKLIGLEGVIISKSLKSHPAFRDKGKRALVRFDQNIDELGLVSHNEVSNSLWIFVTDLEQIK